jgi:hypothetical protein
MKQVKAQIDPLIVLTPEETCYINSWGIKNAPEKDFNITKELFALMAIRENFENHSVIAALIDA